MMKQSSLTGVIEGQGYDERVKLYYGNDVQKTLLFDYWTYRFFSNEENELWVNLNLGEDKFMPHAVKQLGDQIVFVPKFQNPELYYQSSGLLGLDWREYIEKVAPELFVIPQQNWTDMWSSLNVSLEGLSDIIEVTNEDVLLLWLLSSNFHPPEPLISFFPDYIEALASSVLAEHPEHSPSVKDILYMILKKEISLDFASVEKAARGFIVTAYLLDKDESTKDWSALFFTHHNENSLLLAGMSIKLIMLGNNPANSK